MRKPILAAGLAAALAVETLAGCSTSGSEAAQRPTTEVTAGQTTSSTTEQLSTTVEEVMSKLDHVIECTPKDDDPENDIAKLVEHTFGDGDEFATFGLKLEDGTVFGFKITQSGKPDKEILSSEVFAFDPAISDKVQIDSAAEDFDTSTLEPGGEQFTTAPIGEFAINDITYDMRLIVGRNPENNVVVAAACITSSDASTEIHHA